MNPRRTTRRQANPATAPVRSAARAVLIREGEFPPRCRTAANLSPAACVRVPAQPIASGAFRPCRPSRRSAAPRARCSQRSQHPGIAFVHGAAIQCPIQGFADVRFIRRHAHPTACPRVGRLGVDKRAGCVSPNLKHGTSRTAPLLSHSGFGACVSHSMRKIRHPRDGEPAGDAQPGPGGYRVHFVECGAGRAADGGPIPLGLSQPRHVLVQSVRGPRIANLSAFAARAAESRVAEP